MVSEKIRSTSVFGIYQDRASVEYAVCALKIGGVREKNISALHLAVAQAEEPPEANKESGVRDSETQIGGGSLEWFAGTGLIIGPGFRPYLLAGRILAELSAIGAETLGGLPEVLGVLGMPQQLVKEYRMRIETGGILLSVQGDRPECVETSVRILQCTGAEDVSPGAGSAAEFDVATGSPL